MIVYILSFSTQPAHSDGVLTHVYGEQKPQTESGLYMSVFCAELSVAQAKSNLCLLLMHDKVNF